MLDTNTDELDIEDFQDTGEAKLTLLQAYNESTRLRNEYTRMMFRQQNKKRNYEKTFGYAVNLTFIEAEQRVERDGVARRLLELPPDDTWADAPCLIGKKAFIERFNEVLSSCDLFHRLYQLDRLSGMDSYAIMVVGIEGDNDLSQPVVHNEGARIAYLQQYPAYYAPIKKMVTDASNPRYNMPESYNILNKADKSVKQIEVHHSRVLHVAENSLVNNLYGHPRLWMHWNTLDDLVKVVGGSAEMHWIAACMGMHINIPGGSTLKPGTAANLNKQIEDYTDGLARAIKTRDVEITSLGGQTVDPTGLFNVLMSSLATEAGIPLRILVGTEAGELSSEQDRANWAKVIDSRRSSFIEPIILNPLLRLLLNMGVIPEEDNLQWEWESGFKLNRLERGRHAYDIGRAIVNVKKALEKEKEMVPGQQVSSEVDNASGTETARNFASDDITTGNVSNVETNTDLATDSSNEDDYGEEVIKKVVDLPFLAYLFDKEISDKDITEAEDPNRVRSAKIPRINLRRTE